MDTIADFLSSIRNALGARHKEVITPYTKMRYEISRVLMEEGFLSNFRVEGEGVKKRLVINLKYLEDGTPVIRGIERVSTPGRRTYVGWKEIPRVMGGLGTLILTTPNGIMTDKEARHRRVGGELICKVW